MKKIKHFIIGLIVGAMLFNVGMVFAETQTIEAFYNNIKLSIDGKMVELKDTKGNLVEPFIFEGTTYLPVRAVAEALGMEVKYNETTSTVELSKVEAGGKAMREDFVIPSDQLDFEIIEEDGYLKVQVRTDGTKHVYPGTIALHFNRVAGKDILPKHSLVSWKIDENAKTIDFAYKKIGEVDRIILEDYPLDDRSGTYLIPYDEYKDNMLPKLIEGVDMYK
jgi:hypothetical protein